MTQFFFPVLVISGRTFATCSRDTSSQLAAKASIRGSRACLAIFTAFLAIVSLLIKSWPALSGNHNVIRTYCACNHFRFAGKTSLCYSGIRSCICKSLHGSSNGTFHSCSRWVYTKFSIWVLYFASGAETLVFWLL